MANDPRTVTQNEQDLLASLGELVEKEVMGPMEKIGWGPGEPPAPEITAEGGDKTTSETKPEAKEEVKPTDQKTETKPVTTTDSKPAGTSDQIDYTKIDWDALREANGKIAGKYDTPTEAIKGYWHLSELAKRQTARAEAAEKEVADLKVAGASAATIARAEAKVEEIKAETTPMPSPLDLVIARIVEEGGTLDEKNSKELRDAVKLETEATAAKIVSDALNARDKAKAIEDSKWNSVATHMRGKYPGSENFTDEMNLFVRTTPEVAEVVDTLIKANKEIRAAEYAWEQFSKSRDLVAQSVQRAADEKKEVQLDAAGKVREEAVEQARKDAGVMSTMAGGVHEAPDAGPSQDEISEAAAEMRRTGRGERWRAAVFGKDLTGPLFD